MRDFMLTRGQLEQRLVELDRTVDDFMPSREFAMCYAPGYIFESEHATVTCDGCGTSIHNDDIKSEEVIDRYRQFVQKYREHGYDAQIWFFCNECIKEKSLPTLPLKGRYRRQYDPHTNMFFAFKARGDEEYHIAPIGDGGIDLEEISVALHFLEGVKSYKELRCKYDFSPFGDADGFRRCIERVLGLDIEKHRQETEAIPDGETPEE